MKDYKSLQFIQGMKGAENIFLVPDFSRIYVTDLSGVVYLLDENDKGLISIIQSLKIGNFATGVVQGQDGFLYVNGSEHGMAGWLEHGGEVYQVDKELKAYKKITGKFKGINGLSIDAVGNLYFTTGDLEFFFPDGALYKMAYNQELKQYDAPELFIDKLGSANGIFYSEFYNSLVLTETFKKVSSINLKTRESELIFGKSKMIEGFDDLCVDSSGRIWAAEPIGGFLKMYDPKNQKLIRFHIKGLGLASSCRIREKNNKAFIFITEREVDQKNDGRGLIVLSIKELLDEKKQEMQ